jgi:hypothetical protein
MADLKPPEFLPPAVPPAPKMRKPPPKVRAAIEALVTGQVKSITAAAAKVGLARESLSRAFAQPHNRQALVSRAEREVALSSGRAAARLRELIDSASAKVSMDATKFSLQCAGIGVAPGASVNVNIELKAGYVIDLSEPGQPEQKIVGGVVDTPASKTMRGIED